MPADRLSGDDSDGRVVEYYDTVVELSATIVLREAAGWLILSAGQVSPVTYWAEYERIPSADG